MFNFIRQMMVLISQIFTCNGIIKQSNMAVVNDFNLVSTALCRKHTRVNAVPISFEAPRRKKEMKMKTSNEFFCTYSIFVCTE